MLKDTAQRLVLFEPRSRIQGTLADGLPRISPIDFGLVDICGDGEVPVIMRWVVYLLSAEHAVKLLCLEIFALYILAAVKDLLAAFAGAEWHQLL